MANPNKKPKFGTNPNPKKEPRFAAEPQIEGAPLAWRFSSADRDGPFAWDVTKIAEAGFLEMVLAKLRDLEHLSLGEFRNQGSHPVPLGGLAKEAKDRLVAIQFDDLDELFSFRVQGKERVWCIQDRHIMRILWWDPGHKVCPSLKKRT